MSTNALVAGDFELSYFTVRAGTPPHEHVAAVVAWQRRPEPRPSLWRRVRERMAMRGAASSPPPVRHTPPGWTGATDPGGPHEVLHDRTRGRVRVAGREFACPTDGRTLVLLVDGRDAAGVARIAEHAVVVPVVPCVPTAPGAVIPAHPPDVLPALVRALVAESAVRDFLPAGLRRLGEQGPRRRWRG